MSRSFRFAPLLGAALVALAASAPASASVTASTRTTIYFNANCDDCQVAAGATGYGVLGTLVLDNYTPGSAIDASNFVSFAYSGSNLIGAFRVFSDVFVPDLSVVSDGTSNDWSWHNMFSDTVSGSIPAGLPASTDFDLRFSDGLGFHASADGSWYACAPEPGWASGSGFFYGGSDCSKFINSDNGGVGSGSFGSTATVVLGPTGGTVPEPGSLALVALALAAAAHRRRSTQA